MRNIFWNESGFAVVLDANTVAEAWGGADQLKAAGKNPCDASCLVARITDDKDAVLMSILEGILDLRTTYTPVSCTPQEVTVADLLVRVVGSAYRRGYAHGSMNDDAEQWRAWREEWKKEGWKEK